MGLQLFKLTIYFQTISNYLNNNIKLLDIFLESEKTFSNIFETKNKKQTRKYPGYFLSCTTGQTLFIKTLDGNRIIN